MAEKDCFLLLRQTEKLHKRTTHLLGCRDKLKLNKNRPSHAEGLASKNPMVFSMRRKESCMRLKSSRISERRTDPRYRKRHQYAYWWRYPVPGVHAASND